MRSSAFIFRGGEREGGGQGPAPFFSAFLPCSCQCSKKNPQSRVKCTASPPLGLRSRFFLLSG